MSNEPMIMVHGWLQYNKNPFIFLKINKNPFQLIYTSTASTNLGRLLFPWSRLEDELEGLGEVVQKLMAVWELRFIYRQDQLHFVHVTLVMYGQGLHTHTHPDQMIDQSLQILQDC